MKKSILALAIVFGGLIGCNQNPEGIEEKKTAVKAKEKQIVQLQKDIDTLKKQIAAVDPSYNNSREKTLVTTFPVENQTFNHYIEVSGNVESRQNVSLSAEASGRVTNIYVEEGGYVKKGELLVRLDGETIINSIEELKTSLDLAETVYKRRENLWEKNIGTEIQYLEAKNKKESLERQLATARSRLDKTKIRAPFSGNIDELMIKVGEMAQPGIPLLRLVNMGKMFIEADVSEAYIGSFEKGDSVNVELPSLNQKFPSVIKAVGQVINPANRTFRIEVSIPRKYSQVKPNLMAVITIRDFSKENVVIIPTNLIQQDNEGNYVYTVSGDSGKRNAVKKHIEMGKSYNNKTMITSGLSAGEVLINEGFREVSAGTPVKETKVSYNF